MKISHFVENLNRGGLERTVIDLIRAQLQQGHDCQVVCLFEAGSLAEELRALGVAVHACGKRRGLDMRALRRARAHLRAHATGVLHTHNATAHYHAVLASLGLGIRRVINTRHGMGALERASRREWLFRRTLGRTDAVVTVCEAARRELLASGRLPAAKLVAIANGIRVERFRPADADTRAGLARTLGLAERTRIIGTVGRLAPAKHHAALIKAFADVHPSHPSSALVLVGDGSLRTELEAQVSRHALGNRVFLLGDRSDIADLLTGFDIFALSSLTEGYSIALLEACAAGLPIVATDVGGNREIVRDGINGKLVAADSVEQLGAALASLLADPGTCDAMGRAGRDWVCGQGSVAAMARRYESLYKGLPPDPPASA
ncbi:MAG: glycosyltransferase [Rhodocyclaceae bacterium]|nr:MAG: glycosyltransferase [Gammaproteobacteria bacterium]TXG78768.1 MAG: glycosyltransferase [Rhodocyclaceae bacterium]